MGLPMQHTTHPSALGACPSQEGNVFIESGAATQLSFLGQFHDVAVRIADQKSFANPQAFLRQADDSC